MNSRNFDRSKLKYKVLNVELTESSCIAQILGLGKTFFHETFMIGTTSNITVCKFLVMLGVG
jgi:hypothetical protein